MPKTISTTTADADKIIEVYKSCGRTVGTHSGFEGIHANARSRTRVCIQRPVH